MEYLILLVVFIGCGGVEEIVEYGEKKDEPHIFDFVGIVDEDVKEDFERPCALNDWECIRKFLSSQSKCQPMYGPVPDPMKLPVDKFYIPNVNLTITHTNLEIRGFRSARVTEFYLNKATRNLVIAINVRMLNQTSPNSYFTYQRTAKEPITRSDFTTVTYDSATFTAVIPNAPHLKLDHAEIHADIHDGTPIYAIGPRAGNSTDPDVVAAFTVFVANIPSIIREAYVFQSYLITTKYIQEYLCDFGVDSYERYLNFLRNKGYNQIQGSRA